MSLSTRLSRRWTHPTASCIAFAGIGLAGLAGCALKMSPGERIASVAHEESEVKTPVATSALSRILERKSPKPDSEKPATANKDDASSGSSSSTGRGRLFAAMIDRFPSRRDDVRDPFLDAELEPGRPHANIAARDAANDDRPATTRAALAETSKQERSDDDLWKLFDNDATGAVHTGNDDPTVAASEPAGKPQQTEPSDQSVPVWARPRPDRTAARSTKPHTRAASSSVAAPPVRPLKAADMPTVEPQPATAAVADATLATAARHELHDLVTQARQHEQRGALRQARQSAVNAAAIADREQVKFARGEEHPSEVVRRLDERLSASMRDPFGDAPLESTATTSPQGTSPFASGSTLAESLPWTTRIQPQPAAAPPAPAPERTSSAPATNFPTAPEWRGVRANSPVSLAVVEQADSPAVANIPTVRHADVEVVSAAIRTPGGLLPRSLPSVNAPFSVEERPLALNAPPMPEGPLLAPPPLEVTPLAVAPAPPLLANANAVSLAAPAAADEEIHHSSGKTGWIVGGALLAAGLWLFGFRGRRVSRRNSSAAGR